MTNFSPFPAVPNGPIPGNAVPVAYLGSAMWSQLTKVATATTGDLSLSDGRMNPLDLFQSLISVPSGAMAGIAVVIVNGLETPLKLADYFAYAQDSAADDMNGQQLCYPAAVDPDTQTAYNPHEIPGIRSYPRPSLHGGGNPGSPDSGLMGVGLYCFQSAVLNYPLEVNRGLAFTCGDDDSGAMLGVAFTYSRNLSNDIALTSAVTVDVSKQGKADTPSNLQALIEGPGNEYELGTKLAVYGRFASQTPAYSMMRTLLVYVSN